MIHDVALLACILLGAGLLVVVAVMIIDILPEAMAQGPGDLDPNVNPRPPPSPPPSAPNPAGSLSAAAAAPPPSAAPLANNTAHPLQHGDQVSYSIAPDGRTATVQWESAPAARVQNASGDWVDYTLTIQPNGDARYESSQMNATVSKVECSVALDTGGEIHHALLYQMAGDFPGPWTLHERATAGECALAINAAKPQVNATWQGAGLTWTRVYDFGALSPDVEWTYRLSVDSAEGADMAYAFRTIMAGHPPARNGTVQAIGQSYDRASALDDSGPWGWGPYALDWKDEEHGATGGVDVIGPRTDDSVTLHRFHPSSNAGQIMADFTHGASVQQVGDVKTVDPVATVARIGVYQFGTRQTSENSCADWIGRNPSGGSVSVAPPGTHYQRVGSTNRGCNAMLYTHQLPTAVGASVENATYSFGMTRVSDLAFNVVYFADNLNPPRTTPRNDMRADAHAFWTALNAAVPATAAPVVATAPPILGFPTLPSDATGSNTRTATLAMTNSTILQALYGPGLHAGHLVSHAISWQSATGVNIWRNQLTINAVSDTPSLALNYTIPLQPIESIAVASVTTRPGSLGPLDGTPPYARLVLRVNQTGDLADALRPTGYTVEVRDPSIDNTWRRAAAYGIDRPVYTGATATFFASHTTDQWPDGTTALHGKGPFEWIVRPLYSTEFGSPNSNNLQGPWFNVPGRHALCGVAPSAPFNLTVAVGATGITAAWEEPRTAPSNECGPLTYSYRVSDGASARTHTASGLTARTFTATGFPAGDSLTVAVQATNEYGTSAAATWTGRTLESSHIQAANFAAVAVPMNEVSPSLKRERSGSAQFTWTIDPARPQTLPVGVLAPSEYEIYYLRADPDVPGDNYWQPLALGAAGSVYPPARPYELYYHWRTNQAGYWNVAGGFQPGETYRLKLEPHYTDSTVGTALYADFTGAQSRITGAAILPATDAEGHTINNLMNATINATIIADGAGALQDFGGFMWHAEWLQNSQPQSRVHAFTGHPSSLPATATAAPIDCAIPSAGKDAGVDPCVDLVGGDSIQDEVYHALIRAASGATVLPSAFTIFPVDAPCRISTPAPPWGQDIFAYNPPPTPRHPRTLSAN